MEPASAPPGFTDLINLRVGDLRLLLCIRPDVGKGPCLAISGSRQTCHYVACNGVRSTYGRTPELANEEFEHLINEQRNEFISVGCNE